MADHALHHDHPHGLAHQFEDMPQQKESAIIGMWSFLITEILFFGGFFCDVSDLPILLSRSLF